MAVPIEITPNTPESKQEIQQHLEQAQIRHAAAILAGYELLQQMHDRGVLNILRGTLGASDTIVLKLANAANTEESVNAVRNLVSLSRIFASIDPELMHRLADEIVSLKREGVRTGQPGFWTALRIFASQDSRRALFGTAAFVRAFGKALASAPKPAA